LKLRNSSASGGVPSYEILSPDRRVNTEDHFRILAMELFGWIEDGSKKSDGLVDYGLIFLIGPGEARAKLLGPQLPNEQTQS
jgi:hypothetical protein